MCSATSSVSLSASTQNQALAALLFLYRQVLEMDPGCLEGVVRARRSKRLPVVLSVEEVRTVLQQMPPAVAASARWYRDPARSAAP